MTFWVVMLIGGIVITILNTVLFARRPSLIGVVGIACGVAVLVLALFHFAGVAS